MGSKDGAFLGNATLVAGIDSNGDTWPINCSLDGTLEVGGVVTTIPGAVQPVSQSGTWGVLNLSQLVPNIFDTVLLSPTGTNPTTIVYKTGGMSGTTVATLTLTYDGNNNVQTVVRT